MDEKAALKDFYEQCGEKYPEEEMVYKTLRGRLRKNFVINFIQRMSGSLLEIGCNRGMYLQNYNGGERFGIDLSSSVLGHAHTEKPMSLAVADAERLCFREASFDNILCSEVLEHCLHPQDIFNEIASALKPGGHALLTTPNYTTKKRPEYINMYILTGYSIDCQCGEQYFHTAYKPEELVVFAKNAGLNVLEKGTLEKDVKYATKIPVMVLLVGRLLNRPFHSRKFDAANEAFFQTFSNAIYDFCHFTRLDKLLLKMVPQGVRSYIYMQKPAGK